MLKLRIMDLTLSKVPSAPTAKTGLHDDEQTFQTFDDAPLHSPSDEGYFDWTLPDEPLTGQAPLLWPLSPVSAMTQGFSNHKIGNWPSSDSTFAWTEIPGSNRSLTNPSEPDIDFSSLLNDDLFNADEDDASDGSLQSRSNSTYSPSENGSTMKQPLDEKRERPTIEGPEALTQEAVSKEDELQPKRRRISKPSPQSSANPYRLRRPRARKKEASPPGADGDEGAFSPTSQSNRDAVPKNKHTLVERKYRKSLNDRFTDLLKVLPAESETEVAGEGDADANRKMKKGKILEVAKTYITQLEKKHQMAERERFSLERKLDIYQEALRGMEQEEQKL